MCTAIGEVLVPTECGYSRGEILMCTEFRHSRREVLMHAETVGQQEHSPNGH